MSFEFESSFVRYLSAKRSVDDRALNRSVWQTMQTEIAHLDTIHVLELGSGIGTMVERTLEWDLFGSGTSVHFTLVDEIAENSVAAFDRLIAWGEANHYHVDRSNRLLTMTPEGDHTGITLAVEVITAEAFDFMARHESKDRFDLIIANAFLDLVNLDAAMRSMAPLLKKDGIFYFSINYDGVTGFEPKIEHKLDSLIENLYHQDMDKKRFKEQHVGGKHSGRFLLYELTQKGYDILNVGGSDWIVYPEGNGYQEDEAYFLHFIIHTIDGALSGHPDLDQASFKAWINKRHTQIDAGELIYVTHQLDFCVRR